jgi:ribosome maturation factor RimP
MRAPDEVWVPQLKALVEPLVRDSFLELFDLSVRRQGNRVVVEVVLDRVDGVVKVDDCARVSHDLEEKLDELDLIPCAYVLEVSSPGLDRPLRNLEECARAVGHKAQVTASEPVEGQVSFEGVLEAVDDGAVVMRMGEKRRVAIPWVKVRKARRVPEI